MFPASPEMAEAIKADFKDPNRYPVDARGSPITYVFIALKRLGAGQLLPDRHQRQRRRCV